MFDGMEVLEKAEIMTGEFTPFVLITCIFIPVLLVVAVYFVYQLFKKFVKDHEVSFALAFVVGVILFALMMAGTEPLCIKKKTYRAIRIQGNRG